MIMTIEQTIASTGLFKLSSDRFIGIVSAGDLYWVVRNWVRFTCKPLSSLNIFIVLPVHFTCLGFLMVMPASFTASSSGITYMHFIFSTHQIIDYWLFTFVSFTPLPGFRNSKPVVMIVSPLLRPVRTCTLEESRTPVVISVVKAVPPLYK